METPEDPHQRPAGVSDETIEALGKLSEALETVEQARGMLYGFHRLTGSADLALGEAAELFRSAGHEDIAGALERDLVGRNILAGRWTFQLVEEYDDSYYLPFKQAEGQARDQLVSGRRHIFEAEMKEERRSTGEPHHEARPEEMQ